MVNSVEIVFSDSTLVTLVQHYVLLLSGSVWFCNRSLWWERFWRNVSAFFTSRWFGSWQPKLAVIFRHLVRGSSFPACWRLAAVVSVAWQRNVLLPMFETSGLLLLRVSYLKVFENIVAEKLSNFLEGNSLLPASQFLYRSSLRTCEALLTLSHHLQVTLDGGMEGRLVQFDFSVAFDRESHRGLLYKLRSIGVGRQFLSVVSQFLSDRKQRVRLYGKISVPVDMVPGVPYIV